MDQVEDQVEQKLQLKQLTKLRTRRSSLEQAELLDGAQSPRTHVSGELERLTFKSSPAPELSEPTTTTIVAPPPKAPGAEKLSENTALPAPKAITTKTLTSPRKRKRDVDEHRELIPNIESAKFLNGRKRALTPSLPVSEQAADAATMKESNAASVPVVIDNDLFWQDSEITLYDANDPDDDARGVNGIGYQKTRTESEHIRAAKRRQIDDWRKREATEQRAQRHDRGRRKAMMKDDAVDRLLSSSPASSATEQRKSVRFDVG